MSYTDYRGARGANAGDNFHELWALRQTLTLLNQETGLTAVSVEGLRAEDEQGTPLDTWDGVDCTLYFGGDQLASAQHVIIAQLKYSAANPDEAWTIARLTASSNKKRDNSVISRLAKAFLGLKGKRPDLCADGNVVVQLVSNQPIAPAVLSALSKIPLPSIANKDSKYNSDRATLLAATGLHDDDFAAFAQSLDFSESGYESRFAVEERILTTISEWADDDARTAVNDLMRFMRRVMMPEAKGEYITRQSILAQLGFSDPRALFPCPSTIKRIGQLIPRQVSRLVLERMKQGDQRICLHGEGGCGKTTALQELEMLLPDGSVTIIFDCYGSGRYLDSDSFRHRSPDAFLQLSNDLARQLRIPLLVSRSPNLDYPRVFKKRLDLAAEVIASRSPDALLVIVVDAADNSVTAAKNQAPPERSFVHDFVSLGDLPKNVRFLVTARSGRLPSLALPRNFTLREITGFAPHETAAHVHSVWASAPDSWINDFHHLSRGNPRVQRYALDYAGNELRHALDYLLPHGKGLHQIFLEQFEHARHKVGQEQDIQAFCSGLIALPRPVPMVDLAVVSGLDAAHIRDLATDLAPGIRLINSLLSFADEDFEHFVRTEAEPCLDVTQERIADHFARCYTSDAYAAAHIAGALLAAGRKRELIDLINAEREPTAISDPVLRREIHLQRLRLAMKVCRETGNTVDALLTLLIGAEALNTNTAIRQTLIENPDLTAAFVRTTSAAAILREPRDIEHHGPLLFHIMAADARDQNAIAVREGHRQAQAWMRRRAQSFEDQKTEHPNIKPRGWDINRFDVAAEAEALLRIGGPHQAMDRLLSWRPRIIPLYVASHLVRTLISSGDTNLVTDCLTSVTVPRPWDLLLLTPLALAGQEVDLSHLASSLSTLLRRGLIRLDRLEHSWLDDHPLADYLDMILTACEVIVGQGGELTGVIPILEHFADPQWRRYDSLSSSDVFRIDLVLRAYTLLEHLAGHEPSLETFYVDPPDSTEALPPEKAAQQKQWADERKKDLQTVIGPILGIYDTRAQVLARHIALEELESRLQKSLARYRSEEYRFNQSHNAPAIRRRVAVSMTRLLVLRDLDREVLWRCVQSILELGTNVYGLLETEVFEQLALDYSLHHHILSAITARAGAIKPMKAAAEEKISALVRLARVLLPISRADAESLFTDAIEVAGEVNAEAVHEIALCAPLAMRAAGSMDHETKRMVGRDIAIVTSDARIRLGESDNFPWSQSAQALSTLDVSLAFAAVARWEDEGLARRHTLLPHILETALACRTLSPMQASALLSLLDGVSVDLINHIIEEANSQRNQLDVKIFAEDLAREELVRFGQGTRQEVIESLRFVLMNKSSGFWLDRLLKATAFHGAKRPSQTTSTHEKPAWSLGDERQGGQASPLDTINWATQRFVSLEAINRVIDQISEAAKASHTYISDSSILDRMAKAVALGDRVLHLEALRHGGVHHMPDYEIAQALVRRIDAWHESPSVARWCREQLKQVVINLLPGLSRWLMYGQAPLPALLQKSGMPDHEICAALLEGLERHVDTFNAPAVFTFVGFVGQYCLPTEAAQVLTRYARRLVQRIPPQDQDQWNLADIPMNASHGTARFLYALLSDIDVRIRWRAAHALRRLTHLGDTETLDAVVELYDRTSELSYRKPNIPFYWLAARLWLVITLERIATETPSVVRHHGIWLLDIARDEAFPHILVRSFAKSAVGKLVESGNLTLNTDQQDVLASANTSLLRRKKARQRYRADFDRYHYQQRKDRRFDFDSMDTLPYWYSRPLRAFADVSHEEFLNAAERWIVDHWGVQNNPSHWEDEPRKYRDDRRSIMSMMHRQGSLPILERYHTYLEWHAMWCATGELMRTRPLARVQDDAYDSFEGWLDRHSLTIPPLWLADLHGMKPLEERFWFSPHSDVDGWVDVVSDDDFLLAVGLSNDTGMIIVASQHDTRTRDFNLSARVETALVSPDTARALMRALQTVDDSWDYRIPSAGDGDEIDTPSYKLKGWLVNVAHDVKIDEHDPLRYEVRAIECLPSEATAAVLNLEFIYDEQVRWVNRDRQNTVFSYEAWGDTRGDEHEDTYRYDENIRSHGWHLQLDREALRILLNTMECDLIVEVEISRRNTGYEYARYDEKKIKEGRYDRVFLLRRDGTIESTDGHVGAWTVPGT